MRKVLIVVLVLVLGLTLGLSAQDKKGGDEKTDMLKKARQLFEEKKFEDALKVVETGMKKYPDEQEFKVGQYFILMKLERYPEALKIALKRDEENKKKSPHSAKAIADLYVKNKDNDGAIKWLLKAAERGFMNFNELKHDPGLKSLQADKRWPEVIKKVKANLGLGKPAKDFNLTTIDGKPLSLSKYKGKVVLVDFWATWCPPCVKEIPNIKKFYAEMKGKNFEIIGISLDKKIDTVKAYVKENKMEWPVACSEKYWKDPTSDLYGVNSIPSYWVVDKKGILRHFTQDSNEFVKVIKELVAE